MPGTRRKAEEKVALTVTVEVTNYNFDIASGQFTGSYQIRFGNKRFSQGGSFTFLTKRPPDYPEGTELPATLIMVPDDLNLSGLKLAEWMEDQIIDRMSKEGAAE